jgi:hypothetical protein
MTDAHTKSRSKFNCYLNKISNPNPDNIDRDTTFTITISETQRLALIEALSVSGDEHGYDNAHRELITFLEALPRGYRAHD